MSQHHDSRNLFLSGPVGRLEAVLWTPRSPTPPAIAAVVCHPHPLFGGTMHNKGFFRPPNPLTPSAHQSCVSIFVAPGSVRESTTGAMVSAMTFAPHCNFST